MRILVAGGQGQVGSALAHQGKKQGLDIVVLGRSELDITSSGSINAAFEKYQPGLLINAAAYTAVDKAESEIDQAFAINHRGVVLLAEACAEFNIPIFHISTDYVFDGTKNEPYTEEDPVNPVSVYGESKEAGEQALMSRLDRYIILRTSWVFGVDGGNFVKTITRLACDREELPVVSDQFGGPTSASSIARVLITFADRHSSGGTIKWGVYHFCQHPFVSWHAFALKIANIITELYPTKRIAKISPISGDKFPAAAQRPRNSCLDSTKISSLIGGQTSFWIDDVQEVLHQVLTDDES